VEQEVWLRAGMFGAIIVLVVLILVTPSLMGHPTVLTPPLLIVGITPDQGNLTVYVTASVQAYLYSDITVNLTRLDASNASVGWTNVSRSYTYGVEVKVPLNLTYWRIHVWLLDKQDNYFEDNVSLRIFSDSRNSYQLTLFFSFPDDKSVATATRIWTDDFRVAIPRRGTLP
jgi:hypothetical protein